MTDQIQQAALDIDLLKAAVAPLFERAIAAHLAHDQAGVELAWRRILALGGVAVYIAAAAFANAATMGAARKRGVVIAVVEGQDGPQAAANEFVRAFLDAAARGDSDARAEIWQQFTGPLFEHSDDPDSGPTFTAALNLLVQYAAAGVKREQRRQTFAHGHPGARHAASRRKKTAARRR